MPSSRAAYSPDQLRRLREAFPKRARAAPIFTCYRLAPRDGQKAKVPLHPAGTPGVPFDDALRLYNADETLAGLGVKLGPVPGTGLCLWGADYDGAEKGPLPAAWPKDAPTYAERSPSGGDRFHVLSFHRGAPLEGKRHGAVEIYSEGRFFTLTGDRINGAKILPTDPRPYYAAIGVADPRPYGAAPSVAASGPVSPIAEADLSARERVFLYEVRGIDNADLSARDFAVCCELLRRGATDDEARRVLGAGFWRAKLGRRDYIARTLAEAHSKVEGAFRAESRDIGEGPAESEHFPPIFDLPAMLAEAVYVADGAQVVPRSDPRAGWSFEDFVRYTAASVIRTGAKGKPAAVARAWLAHPKRVTVETRTFRAGGELITMDPNDQKAINTWREPPRIPPPADWRERAKLFLDHVAYLVPNKDEREALLDWFAHTEQHPGVLPHVHFLMWARRHGIGRNWVSCVLARVWPGVVALDVDLPALLDGGFNGRLSRKTFAVVNEINEGAGGAAGYRHANRLRTLLTDEIRLVNPKYGRQYVEFNATRWLMFSNHPTALPLDRFDRRVYVIRNPDEPCDAAYYAHLYAAAGDGAFVASVRELLRSRDVSRFNPGMHAPLTEAKQRMIEATTPDADAELEALIRDYPADVITAEHLVLRLFGAESSAHDRMALRFVAARWGVARLPKRVSVRGTESRNIWVLRNLEKWLGEKPERIAREVERGIRSGART